jgi:hypothetical protein
MREPPAKRGVRSSRAPVGAPVATETLASLGSVSGWPHGVWNWLEHVSSTVWAAFIGGLFLVVLDIYGRRREHERQRKLAVLDRQVTAADDAMSSLREIQRALEGVYHRRLAYSDTIEEIAARRAEAREGIRRGDSQAAGSAIWLLFGVSSDAAVAFNEARRAVELFADEVFWYLSRCSARATAYDPTRGQDPAENPVWANENAVIESGRAKIQAQEEAARRARGRFHVAVGDALFEADLPTRLRGRPRRGMRPRPRRQAGDVRSDQG